MRVGVSVIVLSSADRHGPLAFSTVSRSIAGRLAQWPGDDGAFQAWHCGASGARD